jgi:multidrug efflux system outer membrane protein
MKMKLFALTLLTSATLVGCSLAPDYVRPDSPTATQYPVTADEGDASTIGWKEFFKEPRLQSLIATALENNRDLRIAALRIEEARALYNVQRADLLPSLNLVGNDTQSTTPGNVNPSGQVIRTSSYLVGLSIPSFELDFFGRVRSLSNAALAQYLATEEATRAARIALIGEVAKAYFAERALAEQQEIARNTLETRKTSSKLLQQRFSAGASSVLDLRQNEILEQTARASLAVFTRQRTQAANALSVLVGKPLQGQEPEGRLSADSLLPNIPAGLPSDLLTRRPDIRAAEQRLKSANANIGAARAAFFPRISLTDTIGSASNDISTLFQAGSYSWNFVGQLTMPIFDFGRNSGNRDVAEARKNIAVADYEKSIQVAFREVADALMARQTFVEQMQAQRAILDATQERLKLVELRYQNGVANSLDLMDVRRELFTSQLTLIQVQQLEIINSVDLYRALGGGVNDTRAN